MTQASANLGGPVVYMDFTHLGRHVTGIERVTIELFEKVPFPGAEIRPVRARGAIDMILKQQVLLPFLALVNRKARFVLPGFPPSPLFAFARDRVLHYVHDAFLITRPQDLSLKARLYMAWPFRRALTGLRYFLTNSEKTRGEIMPFLAPDATVALYRPHVRNVFGLDAQARRRPRRANEPLCLVSMGTVEPRKNYPAAVRILKELRGLGQADAELHIVGRPGWGDDLALEGTPGVVLHGYLASPAVKGLLERADVYLCTSHDEGLGLPLLEVQYAGLPVAAPDAPVFREALGGSGWYIDPSDATGSARAILDRLAESDARTSCAEAAARNLARWNCAAQNDLVRVQALFAEPQVAPSDSATRETA